MDSPTPRERGPEQPWRRTALAFLAAFAGVFVLFVLMVIVVDPYDSGRFPTFMPAGTPDDRAPTINISRGRDPRFNAVLLGSSRGVLADPRRLSASTGFRFVEMATLGATVREQLAFLHWFARHRPSVEAIVIATDQVWCNLDPALVGEADFPYGLYDDSNLVYLKAALSSATTTFAKERALYALGLMRPFDREGYYDSEAKIAWPGVSATSPDGQLASAIASAPAPRKADLPALARLDAALRELPGLPPIVFWMPPYYRPELPRPDTSAGQDLAACKEALRDWTRRRPRASFLDFATDMPEAADARNFLDPTHVSNRYMRLIEPRIADALNRVK
jgi:hypothetical protein